MFQLRRINIALLTMALFGVCAMLGASAQAGERFCGTIENLKGDVQVMDASRVRILSVAPGSGIPCGGWVRVGATVGHWVMIRHAEGSTAHLAAGAFVQVSQSGADTDPFTLYRGEIFAQNRGGKSLSILTANARARLSQGTMLVTYSPEQEETQLISLESKATLENRFRPERRISVKEGEASSLNFRFARVVPSTPKAVTVASLRSKLDGFPLDDRVHSDAIRAAFVRQQRKFASTLPTDTKAPLANKRSSSAKKTPAPKLSKSDEAARQHWLERITGLSSGVKEVLGRKPASSKAPTVEILERDKDIARDKKRLIEELSKIRPD